MFNKLFSKLLPKRINIKDNTNSILFQIDDDNKINLIIDIKNQSSEAAYKFGLLLFLINEGYYVQSFLDLISNFSKQNPNNVEFEQKVINAWSTKVGEINNESSYILTEDSPVIKPTQFNTTNK